MLPYDAQDTARQVREHLDALDAGLAARIDLPASPVDVDWEADMAAWREACLRLDQTGSKRRQPPRYGGTLDRQPPRYGGTLDRQPPRYGGTLDRAQRRLVDEWVAEQDAKPWPCAICAHGVPSEASETGWECAAECAMTCKPWGPASLRVEVRA